LRRSGRSRACGAFFPCGCRPSWPALFTPSARLERSLLILARKPNYDFEKRRTELDRKAKKDAKREERLQRKQENAANGVEGVDPDLEGIVLGPQPTAEEAGEDTPQ
jgi:hypothetical protein